jgi:hypothetical protein
MWQVIQETDIEYTLYDPEGRVEMYGWPIEEIEYTLSAYRQDEYLRVDLKGQEDVIRLR